MAITEKPAAILVEKRGRVNEPPGWVTSCRLPSLEISIPLSFIAGLGAFLLLPRIHDNPVLTASFAGAAAVLLVGMPSCGGAVGG